MGSHPLTDALTARVKRNLLYTVVLCSIVVLLGSSLNNNGLKYARVTSNNSVNEMSPSSVEAPESGVVCSREVFLLNVPDTKFCCEGLRRQDWVCVASFDTINMIMTKLPWAYLVPILPWFSSVVFSKNAHMSFHLRRLALYLIIFIFRALVIYVGLAWLQEVGNAAFRVGPSEAGRSSCWYADLLKSKECFEQFDFSDHIVFYVVNVIIPCTLEISWTLHEVEPTAAKAISWARCVPTLVLALTLCFFSLRNIMFTAMYFHTPLESAFALVVIVVTVVLPIYFNAEHLCSRLLASQSK